MKKLNFIKKSLMSVLCLGVSVGFGQTTTFTYTGTIDSYTVPAGVTSISIEAFGAQGGNNNGGLGASIYGEFTVVPGQVLSVVVGEQGSVNTCGGGSASGGGGGGSFVWDPSNASLPMVAAGAGGGGNENWGDVICRAGLPGESGENGTSGAEGLAAGGIGGNGGDGNAPSGTGSGGGGWISDGMNSAYDNLVLGGKTIPTFSGGPGSVSFGPGGDGGFGGGGGAVCGCGGGGGYSGGAGGNGSSCRAGGGGGGSYNSGNNINNVTGIRVGDGEVLITVLCTAITVNVSSNIICLGDSFTLTATGLGNITWDNGVTNAMPFTPNTTGMVTYTAISDNGGDCGTTVDVDVLDVPAITYTTSDEINGTDGAIDITVSGGVPAYVFDWDNDGTGDFDDAEDLTGLAGGTYVVVVEGADGCSGTETIIVDSQLGIDNKINNSIVVYPNPTTDNITIESNGEFNYSLYTIDGRKIMSGNGYDKKSISLAKLAKGSYLVVIESKSTIEKINLIVD